MRLIACLDNSTDNFPFSEVATVVEYIEETLKPYVNICKVIVDDHYTRKLDTIFKYIDDKTRYVYIDIDTPPSIQEDEVEVMVEYIIKSCRKFNTLTGFKVDRYKDEKHNRRCNFYFNHQEDIPESLIEDLSKILL